MLIKTAIISRMVKQSRKQKRQSRKQRKSHRRNHSQRGGAASFNAPYEALTGPARDAAQVGPLDRSIAALPGLIPRQGGGHYRQRNGNAPPPGFVNVPLADNAPSVVPVAPVTPSTNVLVGGSAPFGDPYTYKLNGGGRYRQRKNKRSRRSRRNQRGGNAPFNAPYSFGYKLPGVNEQFASEGSVNSLYSQNRGAQGY